MSQVPQVPPEAAAAPVDLLAEEGPIPQVSELAVAGVAAGRGLLFRTLAPGWQPAKVQAREAISTPDLPRGVEGLLFWRYSAVGVVARQGAMVPGMAPPTSKTGVAQASVKCQRGEVASASPPLRPEAWSLVTPAYQVEHLGKVLGIHQVVLVELDRHHSVAGLHLVWGWQPSAGWVEGAEAAEAAGRVAGVEALLLSSGVAPGEDSGLS